MIIMDKTGGKTRSVPPTDNTNPWNPGGYIGTDYTAVGIDPSYGSTGFVRLDSHDGLNWFVTIAESFKAPGPEKSVAATRDEIRRAEALAEELPPLPKRAAVVIESVSHSSANRVAMLAGLGVVLRQYVAREQCGERTWFDVSPSGLKKFATGSGAGGKDLIRLGVYKRWGFEHSSDDVIDAYAMARLAAAIASSAYLATLPKPMQEAVRVVTTIPKR